MACLPSQLPSHSGGRASIPHLQCAERSPGRVEPDRREGRSAPPWKPDSAQSSESLLSLTREGELESKRKVHPRENHDVSPHQNLNMNVHSSVIHYGQ